MKKIWLVVCITLWAVIAAAAVVFLIPGVSEHVFGGNFIMNRGNSSVIKEQTLSLTGVNAISIDSHAYGIEFENSADDQIHITQYGSKNTPDKEIFTADISNGTLRIKNESIIRIVMFGLFNDMRITVALPTSWHGDMDANTSSGGIKLLEAYEWKNAKLKTSSGGIKITEVFAADSLDAQATSGSVTFEGQITVKNDLNVRVSSGGVHLKEKVSAEKVTISSTSGGISSEEINTKGYDISVSSGGVKINGLNGNGSVRSTSGGVKVYGLTGNSSIRSSSGGVYAEIMNGFTGGDFSASSGGVRVDYDPSLSFEFTASTSSGGIKSDFNISYGSDRKNTASGQYGSSPAARLSLKTSSGGIKLSQR